MDRWTGKVAVVTGASAGIGAAIVLDLARAGCQTIGLARRSDRIEALRQQLPAAAAARLYARRCDVSSESDILTAFRWIAEQFGRVDILVNNAGVLYADLELLSPENTAQMRNTLEVNVLAPVLCTREAFRLMRSAVPPCGHVVLINSISGHWVPYSVGTACGSLNIYEPSKHALTAMTEVLRQEFQAAGTRVKVSVSVERLPFCVCCCPCIETVLHIRHITEYQSGISANGYVHGRYAGRMQ